MADKINPKPYKAPNSKLQETNLPTGRQACPPGRINLKFQIQHPKRNAISMLKYNSDGADY
jgi:hypothetical protein